MKTTALNQSSQIQQFPPVSQKAQNQLQQQAQQIRMEEENNILRAQQAQQPREASNRPPSQTTYSSHVSPPPAHQAPTWQAGDTPPPPTWQAGDTPPCTETATQKVILFLEHLLPLPQAKR